MLINFELTPLKHVMPWGEPNNLSLSWFGLTDGQYWISVGETSLFEYSEHARSAGAGRYCEYQVVRLLEDILDMLPSIMEPIPPTLVRYLSGDSGKAWQAKLSSWASEQYDAIDEDEYWRLADLAGSLSYNRFLDSAYLSPSATILIWSDEKDVHIEWDNSEKFIDEKVAWTARKGHFHMPREVFIREVESFHFRLIEQMTSRVSQVVAGALPPDIRIDFKGLLSEHEQRRNAFSLALRNTISTSWGEVEQAILAISEAAA
ncbi:DUF5984 family protein [Massilia horti]|uniref:Uncharacterized protein n=1 Tax=Massilia horti TaxID=2562153 RepID=A0A4Y9T289_9BURK|nr:DUF5984 family protein [Massilia horti]TFW31642.1 hypothetical protein E4O92_13000 [Massilia horti]